MMSCNNVLSSPAYALYRVFVTTGFESSATSPCQSRWLCPSRFVPQQRRPLPRRPYSATPQPEPFSIKDRDIKSFAISLIGPNGQHVPSIALRRVLYSLREDEHVVQLTPDGKEQLPVCKIMTSAEIYRARKEKKAASKAQKRESKVKSTPKEIELNWAIDRHDLAHHLNKLQDHLEDGFRVNVLLTKKRRGQQATPEERQGVVDRILERAKTIEGLHQYKPAEGDISSQLRLYFEPRLSVRKIELHWGIPEREMEEPWGKIERFLEKGSKVHVIIVTKKRSAQSSTDERQRLVDMLRDRAMKIDQVKEYKPSEGDLSNTITLFFEGKPKN